MADPVATPASMAAPAPCCMPSACASCPCADRLARVERTVGRLRLWLLVALGVLILLIGIGIGADGARRDAMHRAEAAHAMPHAMPLPPQGPMGSGPHGAAPMGPQGPGPMGQRQDGRGPDARPGRDAPRDGRR